MSRKPVAVTEEQWRQLHDLRAEKYDLAAARRATKVAVSRDETRAFHERVAARTDAAMLPRERDFADRLRALVASGVPARYIQSEVLKTSNWETWVKWRDLGENTEDL